MAQAKGSKRKVKLDAGSRRSRDPNAASAGMGAESAIGALTFIKIVDLANGLERAASAFYGTRFDLRLTDIKVLAYLALHPALSMIEISRFARIDKAWISRSMQGLTKRGYVEKSAMPGDERAVSVTLTKQGKELVRTLAPVLVRRQTAFLRGHDKRALDATLDSLLDRVETIIAEDEAEYRRMGPRVAGRRAEEKS